MDITIVINSYSALNSSWGAALSTPNIVHLGFATHIKISILTT